MEERASRRRPSSEADYSSVAPRLISGSVGAIVTSMAVTPLEVVKVRQQASAQAQATPRPPANVSPCPRGCGTFVLNNGLMECLLPKSAVPYFDKWGNLSKTASQLTAKKMATSSASQSNLGVFALLRRIFVKEGFSGIYAGLPATLAMSVPNTVLYFTSYDEIVSRLRRYLSSSSSDDSFAPVWVPLVGGSSARFLASVATAPLELIRTRQASFVGQNGESAPGLWTEFRALIKAQGVPSLYRGLAPTLWRDVPFSAIYWMFLERFKKELKLLDPVEETPLRASGHAFFSGAAAGMVAAAATTPFDVCKTRMQMIQKATETITRSEGVLCHHYGAIAYKPPPLAISGAQNGRAGTLLIMKDIVEKEGITSLWRGNQTRMLKVAPACAIMISCYELGKRIME